jgi:serine protease Do
MPKPASLAQCWLWCLLVGVSWLLPVQVEAALADTIERVRPSIVGVGAVHPPRQPNTKGPPFRFVGTGFVVGDGSLVVTNAHVLDIELDSDARETLAVFSGRGSTATVHPAQLVETDSVHDLALLRIGQRLPALSLAGSEQVREGQRIAFTGFPIGVVLGLYPVTHEGIVAAITPAVIPAPSARSLSAVQIQRMRQPFDVYQLDATAYPGNSGSPVFTATSGRVIGVLNSVFIKETKESLLERPSGISYAIPVEHVAALLRLAGNTRRD